MAPAAPAPEINTRRIRQGCNARTFNLLGAYNVASYRDGKEILRYMRPGPPRVLVSGGLGKGQPLSNADKVESEQLLHSPCNLRSVSA